MRKIEPILMLLVLAVNVYGGGCPRFRGPDGDGQIAEIELINRLAAHLIATNRKVEQSNRKINPDFRLYYYGIIPRQVHFRPYSYTTISPIASIYALKVKNALLEPARR